MRGLEYEADPRHAEIIVSELGLQNSKPVITPGVKEPAGSADEAEDTGIQTAEDSKFFGISAGFNSFSNKGKDLIVPVSGQVR